MTDAAYARAKYMGSALPGNGETVVIFTSALPASTYTNSSWMQMAGINRVYVSIKNDQAGTLKAEYSDDGVTWTQYIPDQVVAIPAANSTNDNDYLIEPYPFWRLRWTNGATPQTTFKVYVALVDQRNVGN